MLRAPGMSFERYRHLSISYATGPFLRECGAKAARNLNDLQSLGGRVSRRGIARQGHTL